MELLKQKRFWAAFGLGLALCALAALAVNVILPGHESFWERYISPVLSRTLLTGIVLLVSILTGIIIRPRRPERLAVAVGFIGGVVLNLFLIGGFLFFAHRAGYLSLSAFIVEFLPLLYSSITLALRLAVICWLAANFWRATSWKQFWRGPGGAILKGSIVAGLLTFPIFLALSWYQQTVLVPQYVKQLSEAGRHLVHQTSTLPWLSYVLSWLGSTVSEIMIVAILVSLKPKPLLGAFAGSGLVLVMISLSFLLMRIPVPTLFSMIFIGQSIGQVLKGAIAGSFAGRWSEIEIAKTE